MNRFFHEKSHNWLKQVLALLLFLGIFLVFTYGLSGISKKTAAEETKNLHSSISRGISHCYATNGFYPESLEYLKENYHISYDTDKYFVDYQVLGENIFPDVTIIEKQEESP